VAFFVYADPMSQRIQVQLFHPLVDDMSWATQELIEGYVFAWIKSERHAASYLAKYLRGNNECIARFTEAIADDPDFEDLKAEIWQECDLPEQGTLEFHIWQIERHLANPQFPDKERVTLYKVLGEFRGWLVKPGDGTKLTQINMLGDGGKAIESMRTMSPNDAERIYSDMLSGGI